jgi:hypothetical protein
VKWYLKWGLKRFQEAKILGGILGGPEGFTSPTTTLFQGPGKTPWG